MDIMKLLSLQNAKIPLSWANERKKKTAITTK